MPEIFGWQHLIILGVFLVVFLVTTLLSKKLLRTGKQQTILIKIIAGLLLASVIANRISVAIKSNNLVYATPYTYCSMSSLVISLLVLLGKPDMKAFQCFWYMAFVGGIVTMIYPDFIGQNASVLFPATITGILHHAFDIILCVIMLQFKWFTPSLKTCYYFPMMFCSYIVIGLFAIKILNFGNAMCINGPLLSGTPLYWWFIWIVGSALVAVFSLICEVLKKIYNTKLANKNDCQK